MARIAIIGMGLIGGSIGLALKQANLKDTVVAGASRSRESVRNAKRLGAIDEEAGPAEYAARGAGLVIIASPIMTVPAVMQEIAPVLEPGAVVTDVCSTKAQVMRWAQEFLPESAHFVGGHPMAGKEQSGIDAADPALFHGRAWVIVPSVDAPEPAVRTVLALAQLAGAEPVFMDAQEHDSYVAAISHLPLALASALFSVAFGSAAWPELARLASSGFRDTTRLASGSPEMSHDIVQTNRDNIVHWIDRLQQELSQLRDVIASGDSKRIAEAFTRAHIERENFLVNGPPRRETGEPIERLSLTDMMLGSKVGDMLRKQESIIRAAEQRAEKKR
jgi:prephenate dehydrogenase